MTTFKNITLFCLLLSLLLCGQTLAFSDDEVSLFDSNGKPIAYITVDDDFTIYLWNGKPVAYLYNISNNIHIYDFGGKHLGWFEDGTLWDHNGNAVGFTKGSINIITQLEPLKGLKQLNPLKGLRGLQPLKPLFTYKWSKIPLGVYLAFGECEPGILVKDFNGNKITISRSNGETWLLKAMVRCSWSRKYEGKIVWIKFSHRITEIMNNDGDISGFWTEEEIDY